MLLDKHMIDTSKVRFRTVHNIINCFYVERNMQYHIKKIPPWKGEYYEGFRNQRVPFHKSPDKDIIHPKTFLFWVPRETEMLIMQTQG